MNIQEPAHARAPAREDILLPNLDALASEVLERGMKAKTRIWDVNKKDWIEHDDIRAQLETVKLFFAYKHGMPVQRTIKIEATFRDNEDQLFALVQSSPEARKELIRAGVITEEWLESKAKKLK